MIKKSFFFSLLKSKVMWAGIGIASSDFVTFGDVLHAERFNI